MRYISDGFCPYQAAEEGLSSVLLFSRNHHLCPGTMSLEEKYKAEAERDLHVSAQEAFKSLNMRSTRSQAYTIGCEIGRGVRSIVYSAQCSSGILRGRVVAVKKVCNESFHQVWRILTKVADFCWC